MSEATKSHRELKGRHLLILSHSSQHELESSGYLLGDLIAIWRSRDLHGRIILYDANKTPYSGSMSEAFRSRFGLLADGILSYL
jgi:hypothetical protein